MWPIISPNTYPYQYDGTPTEFVRVEAYGAGTSLPNVLQVMDSERPDQYRGVPYLAQVIEPLLQLRRYTEAEIMAAVVQSFFTAFVKTEAGADDMPFNEPISADQDEVSKDPNEYELGPGADEHHGTWGGHHVCESDPPEHRL